MDKYYVLVYNHLRTARILLVAREGSLVARSKGGSDVQMEIKKVRGLLRTIRRSERDLMYWFEPNTVLEDRLPFSLEKDYYDEADVPDKDRFLQE